MKKISLLFTLCFSFLVTFAQNDTTVIFNGNKIVITRDNDNVSVFVERIEPGKNLNDSLSIDTVPPYIVDEYLDDPFNNDTIKEPNDDYNFGDRFFNPDFSERIQRNLRRKQYDSHISGFFFGFSNLSSRDLHIGSVPGAVLKYSSYEIGWTIFNKDIKLTKPCRNYAILFVAGLGFRYNQYNADLNTAFRQIGGMTVQTNAPIGIDYTKSYLSAWYIHMPVVLEWQKKKGPTSFFIQAGVEAAVKLSGKSKIKYYPDDDREMVENIDKNLNINPFTIDAKLQIGINSISIYAKYGLLTFFRTDRGAYVIPVSVGFNLHF